MKRDLINIPNILTYIRIALVPAFVASYLNSKATRDFAIAALIVVISGLTDILDGYIARRFNMITLLGKIIDPIADKLMQAAVVFCLSVRFTSALWLAAIFLVKEIATAYVTYLMLLKKRRLDGSLWFGKAATAVFYIVNIILVGFPNLNQQAFDMLILVVAAFMIFAFVNYVPAILNSKSFDEYK